MSAAVRLGAACLAALLAAPLAAQDGRLEERLPPAALPGVRAAIAEARVHRLPAEPLVQRALEGAARGVEPERIVAAVREQANQLWTARQALGPRADVAELAAAAGALYAGVTPGELGRLSRARARGSLAAPLVTLADFIERGVPREVASSVVLSLVGAGMQDRSYAALRRAVAEDIVLGAAPAEAASTRARGALERSGHVRGRPASRRVPTAPPVPRSPVPASPGSRPPW